VLDSKIEAYEEEKNALLEEIHRLKSFILVSEHVKERKHTNELFDEPLLTEEETTAPEDPDVARHSLLIRDLDEIPQILHDPDPLSKIHETEQPLPLPVITAKSLSESEAVAQAAMCQLHE
jgi:hypothetical protein